MIRSGVVAFAVAGFLLGACSSGDAIPEVEATGPPAIRADVVANHAEQFDTDVPVRPAGSQEELAAATYISGHLQLAGYVVFLDGVPVRDLVRSTNVVARAPSGEAPRVVVLVPYDTSEEFETDGSALGLFLELARALRVARGGHDVSFIALGAEHADIGKGNLGSRRAAQGLLDDDHHPLVISLGWIADGVCGEIDGDLPGVAIPVEYSCDPLPETPNQPDVFAEAGFEHVTISGDPAVVGNILLDFLASGSD
ncbi:MAG: hypothetical protein GEU71_01805 [Actinobacteria bacterium]|nr:hypothetical protein [Actinomycetota bacterium]